MKQKTWIVILIVAVAAYTLGMQKKSLTKVSQEQSNTPTPIPASFEQQRQCGIDARDFMKQRTPEMLIESSYSTNILSCVAYTQTFDTIHFGAPSNKALYNITTNKLLGGYIYIAPTNTNGAISEYWISSTNPIWSSETKQEVSQEIFNKYIQSLGLHVYQ